MDVSQPDVSQNQPAGWRQSFRAHPTLASYTCQEGERSNVQKGSAKVSEGRDALEVYQPLGRYIAGRYYHREA
jgi:hypothetical protein